MTESDATALLPANREKIYRRNAFFFMVDGIFFLVALGVISSTTVIPDFVRRLTDSEILIGLSGSLFDIGWTLPQLFVARYIVRYARKKWWFAGPNIPVRFVILIFAAIMVMLGRDNVELILLVFFVCYSVAAFGDGIVAVPWADLSGTSMDNRWRARVFGVQSAITGLIMLAITPIIGLILAAGEFPDNYAILFGIAGLMFVFSIIPVLFIYELPGGKAVDKLPAFSEFLPYLGRVLTDDAPFRAILSARLLTTLFAMAAPFYIGFTTENLGLTSEVAVPTLLAMQTLGGIGGAVLYTWLGAKNNLMYIRLALVGGAILPLTALIADSAGPLPLYLGFLMSGLATINLAIAFINWVVTYAEPDQRPIYVGLFNTISAVISMIAPFVAGTIAQFLGYQPLFLVSLVMALGALFVTLRYVTNGQEVVPETV